MSMTSPPSEASSPLTQRLASSKQPSNGRPPTNPTTPPTKSLTSTSTYPPETHWTIVLQNLGLVYKIANERCRSPQDREDLVQEGLIGLYEAARRFNPSANVPFASWACIWIRKYVMLFYQRRTKDGVTDQLDDVHENVLNADEQTFVKTELRKDLLKHVNRLNETERLIILLRWFSPDKVTHADLAKQTGLTIAAMSQTERVAFQKLRSLLTTGRIR